MDSNRQVKARSVCQAVEMQADALIEKVARTQKCSVGCFVQQGDIFPPEVRQAGTTSNFTA